MIDLWNNLAESAGIALNERQTSQLERYLDLLLETNKKINLTRITDRAMAQVSHVGDALTVLPFLPKSPHRLADVGSGGGVPGIPLAIARPDVQITLVEATQKKANFLKQTAQDLELANVTVLPLRGEDVGQSDDRETFDVAVARAVATIDWLAEWCLPLVKRGGKVLLMKGPKHAEELPVATRAIRACGGGEAIVHPVQLPGSTGLVIVDIPKIGKTDKRYPRPATSAKGKAL